MPSATGFLGARPNADAHHICRQRVATTQSRLRIENTGHFRSRRPKNAMNSRESSNHVNVLFNPTGANMIAGDRIRATSHVLTPLAAPRTSRIQWRLNVLTPNARFP
jgi:hypothetical protein